MTVEIISLSISTKVWDRTGIELVTPRSAVRHTSVARHVTDCATRLGSHGMCLYQVMMTLHFLNGSVLEPSELNWLQVYDMTH